MDVTVKVDTAGVGVILQSEPVSQMVQAAASRVASALPATIEGETVDVRVDAYVTDRVAAAVWVLSPRARVWQAEYGILTHAAGTLGVEVTSG